MSKERTIAEKQAALRVAKDDSWKVFQVGSLLRFLKVVGKVNLPGDIPYDEGEFQKLKVLSEKHRLRTAEVLLVYQKAMNKGFVKSPFNAFSQIDRTDDGYFTIKPRWVDNGKEIVRCFGGAVKAVQDVIPPLVVTPETTPQQIKDHQTAQDCAPHTMVADNSICSMAKVVSGGIHVANGKLTIVMPAKEDKYSIKFNSTEFAVGCRDIALSLIDPQPTETLCGNDLAFRLFHSLNLYDADNKGLLGADLSEVLPPARREGDLKITFEDCVGGAKIKSLSKSTLKVVSDVDITKMASVCDTLYEHHKTMLAYRGGSRHGMSAYLDESWDGIPCTPAKRVNMNYMYDLMHSGLHDSKRLVVKTKNLTVAEAIQLQLPKGAVVVMEGSATPKSQRRSIMKVGGVIAIPSVSKASIVSLENDLDTKFPDYYDLTDDVLTTSTIVVVRETVVASREAKRAVAMQFDRWAIYISYLAVAKSRVTDISVNGSSEEMIEASKILEAEWKANQELKLGLSTYSHSNFLVMEMSSDKFALTHYQLIKLTIAYQAHASQYIFTGASFWSWCLANKYAKFLPCIQMATQLEIDPHKARDMGEYVGVEAAQEIESSFDKAKEELLSRESKPRTTGKVIIRSTGEPTDSHVEIEKGKLSKSSKKKSSKSREKSTSKKSKKEKKEKKQKSTSSDTESSSETSDEISVDDQTPPTEKDPVDGDVPTGLWG